ncbi:MAG: TIGR02117 family protein [Sphingomicrobium sp.]
MARRQRKSQKLRRYLRLALLAIAAVPLLYLTAALIGAAIPVNRSWTEPEQGTTIYLASNGIHADIIMPVNAQELDWAGLLPRSDVATPPAGAQWIAFGAGERVVYLETPRWRDLRAATAFRALTRGERILHVEWVTSPSYAVREIRLRPEEYRRLWSSVRASFRNANPKRIDHRGYGDRDAFYEGIGHASAFDTCNHWVATQLRTAGVRTSIWSPFAQGLLRRYRPSRHRFDRLSGSSG